MGPVENAVRRNLYVGQELPTPTGKASFTIDTIEDLGIRVSKLTQRITWEELENVPQYMTSCGNIMQIGATKGEAKPDTLEECLRQTSGGKTMKASYVASILESADIVKIDRNNRPMRIRLIRQNI